MKRTLDKIPMALSRTTLSRLFAGLSVAMLYGITGTAAVLAQEQQFPPDDAPFEDILGAPLVAPAGPGLVAPAAPAQPYAPPALPGTGGTWAAQGPGPAQDGQVENLVPDNEVSGAVHALAAHPTNPDILYLGGVNGGVWKTTNATDLKPTWSPLTDSFDSLSIGALEFDTSDTNHNTLWAGIGRFSSFSRQGGQRTGLLKTTDGGANWSVVDGGGALISRNISGIAPRGNTIVVSVDIADSFTFGNIGIFRSTDGGATFTQISSGTGATTGLPGGSSFDLGSNRNAPTVLYTSTKYADIVGGTNGIYKSTDTGATWTKVSSAAMDALVISSGAGATSNIEISVGNSGEVYVAILNSGQLRNGGVFRSPDGNVGTWVAMDPLLVNEGSGDVGTNPRYKPDAGLPGGQGAVHFSILADPNNASVLYVGGDRQPSANNDTGGFPNSIGANNYTGRLFRGDASQPATGAVPSPQWAHLTHSNNIAAIPGGGTASNSAPHADSREMVFDANGNIIEGDDAGVNRRTSPQNNSGDWFSINGNLQVTEQHDIAYDTISNFIISGNQDTGTTQQSAPGSTTWDSVGSGDGGDVAVSVDPSNPAQSIRYSSSQNLGSFRKRTYDASGALVSQTFPAKLVVSGAPFDPNFVTPVEVNAVDANRLLFGGDNGLYESFDQGATMSQLGFTSDVNSSDGGNMMVYGGRSECVDNPYLIYAAVDSDIVIRTAAAGAVVSVGGYTGDEVRGVIADPEEWNTVFAIDSDQVFMSTDAGASWSDITGDLSTAYAPLDLRSIEFIRVGTRGAVVVGTSRGVYAARDTNYSSWIAVGGGLPNTPVWDLGYDAGDDVLVAGTLGRGAWKMTQAAETILPLDDSLDYGDAPATYCDASHVRGGPAALFLGTVAPDGEFGVGISGNGATGDDTTGADDEDAVAAPFPVYNGSGIYHLEVPVNNSGQVDAQLVGWIDWNTAAASWGTTTGIVGDGSFTNEALDRSSPALSELSGNANCTNNADNTFTTGNIPAGCIGTAVLQWTGLPPIAAGGSGVLNTYIRLRITSDLNSGFYSDSSPSPFGNAADGEVEDAGIELTTTPITLGYFKAKANGNPSDVDFTWQTVTEVGNLGFNLYARDANGKGEGRDEWSVINSTLIPNQLGDSVETRTYHYSARGVAGSTFALGDVDVFGKETIHGPFPLGAVQGVDRSNRRATDWKSIKAEHKAKRKMRNAERAKRQEQRIERQMDSEERQMRKQRKRSRSL